MFVNRGTSGFGEFHLKSNLSAVRTCDVLSHADSRHAGSCCLFRTTFLHFGTS